MSTKRWVDVTTFVPDATDDQKYQVIATAILGGDGKITFEGDTNVFPDLIMVPGGVERPVEPKDGLAYLQALRYELHTPYACATDVQE